MKNIDKKINKIMNFENINQRPLSLIDKNAEKIIKKYPDRISEDSFYDIYKDSEIKADKEYASRMEEEFNKDQSQESKDAKKIADAIEIVINNHIDLSNWLDYGTCTYKTSRYDDIKNGIDTILEFINEDNKNDSTFLGVAFDITYKNDVRDKFLRIKREIEEKKINKVKYFQSEESNYKGQIENIPRLIIGLDIKTGEELIELFLELGGKKKLGNHFFQFELIDELLYQLDTFMKYAEKVNNQNAYILYKEIKEKIEEIQKEKDKLNTPDKDYRNEYFYNFCDICDNIFNR
ncbi:hypothetical protein K9M42_00995 [Patescibacteria group bacterium]|nr:hypothetical protein [Patescibacteria group bacterium]